MKFLATKIKKQWNAIWNKACKGSAGVRDHETQKKIRDLRMLPDFICKIYEIKGMTCEIQMAKEGERVFSTPRLLICDQELKLDEFRFGGLFDNYVPGERIIHSYNTLLMIF